MLTGRSIPAWAATAPPPPELEPPPRDLHAEVCVIGAGIAGLSTALCLLEAGHSVVVLERNTIGAGETMRSTGHLSTAVDDRYQRLSHQHGEAAARCVADSHRYAIDMVERWVARHSISCGFRRLDGYLLESPDTAAGFLGEEALAARCAGLRVEELDCVPGLPRLGPALRFPDQARIDPGAYVGGLAEAVRRAGGRIHAPAEVIGIEDGSPCRLLLRCGAEAHASSVVICTNVPFHRQGAYHNRQAAYRSFAIAARAPRGTLPDALFWDTAQPYHHARWFGRSGDEDLLIVGGGDHKTGQRSEREHPFSSLELWAQEFCPDFGDIEYAWSGQVVEPVCGPAFIGRDPGAVNIYVVTGDSGNGLTHGTLAGPLLAALIEDREHPWQALYDPARTHYNRGWVRENANAMWQYRDWIAPSDAVSIDAIAPGDGAVLRHGLHRWAVHRDDGGTLHAFNARCPHYGCIVRWNMLERSWDCPCHGSRFAALDGHVLNGPAHLPLEPVVLEAPLMTPACVARPDPISNETRP